MKTCSKLLIIVTILVIAACSKENMEIIDVFGNPKVLVGKWKLSETLSDPGDGSGKWTKVSRDNNQYIEFKENGELIYGNYKTYMVKDSTTLTFTEADGVTYQYLSYALQNGILSLSPAGPIWCIEACGTRYKKVE
jgi:hypothetical protein